MFAVFSQSQNSLNKLHASICGFTVGDAISCIRSVPNGDNCFILFIFSDDESVGDVDERKPPRNSTGKTGNDRFAKD